MPKKILFILLFVISPDFIGAINYSQTDSLALRGIDLVHHNQFQEGIEVLKQITALYPEEPMGYFFIAAAYQTLIDTYRNEKYKADFEKYIELAIKKSDQKIKSPHPQATDYFYVGASYGYRGINRSFRGDWWGAFWDGGRGKKNLEKALELDPTNYHAYYGLGTYNYWRSVKSKILWWLPFFGDQRKKGIAYTKLSIAKGKFAKDEAKWSLIRIYTEEKNYNQVLIWADSIKLINLEDIQGRWFTGLAYIGLGKWPEAERNYIEIISLCKNSPYYNVAGEVEARYYLAWIYYNQNLLPKSLGQLGFIFANQQEIKDNDYAKDFIDKAKELKEKIKQRQKGK